MKIRKAKLNNKREFLRIQKDAFPNLDIKKQARYFDAKLKNKEIFAGFEGQNYVGHICFSKYLLNPPFAPGIFIEELAVAQMFRGKGYGSLLIRFLTDYCKNNKIPCIYSSTEDYEENKNISYYQKLGFEIIGNLKEINPHSEYKHGQIFMGMVIR